MTSATHAHSDPSGDHGDDHNDHAGVGKYLVVFAVLCVLTAASFFTCSDYWPFKDTPSIGWSFMMAVSCTKALLVILFFMHLLWEANWKYILTIPAMFMSVYLICMMVPDIGLRAEHYSEERMQFAAEPVVHPDGEHHDGHGGEPAKALPDDANHTAGPEATH